VATLGTGLTLQNGDPGLSTELGEALSMFAGARMKRAVTARRAWLLCCLLVMTSFAPLRAARSGLPSLAAEDIRLVESWVAQERPL